MKYFNMFDFSYIDNAQSYCNIFLIIYNDIFGTESSYEMIHSDGLGLTVSHHFYLQSPLYQLQLNLCEINNLAVCL
jgi:hypothetical protein